MNESSTQQHQRHHSHPPHQGTTACHTAPAFWCCYKKDSGSSVIYVVFGKSNVQDYHVCCQIAFLKRAKHIIRQKLQRLQLCKRCHSHQTQTSYYLSANSFFYEKWTIPNLKFWNTFSRKMQITPPSKKKTKKKLRDKFSEYVKL